MAFAEVALRFAVAVAPGIVAAVALESAAEAALALDRRPRVLALVRRPLPQADTNTWLYPDEFAPVTPNIKYTIPWLKSIRVFQHSDEF